MVPFVPLSPFAFSFPSCAGLFIVRSQIQHLRVANYSYCANLAPYRFDLFFCLMTHHAAPLGFGLRLTMHANDGICCQGRERAGGALGRQRRRFFISGAKQRHIFAFPRFFFFCWGYFGSALMSSLSAGNQTQAGPRKQPKSMLCNFIRCIQPAAAPPAPSLPLMMCCPNRNMQIPGWEAAAAAAQRDAALMRHNQRNHNLHEWRRSLYVALIFHIIIHAAASLSLSLCLSSALALV